MISRFDHQMLWIFAGLLGLLLVASLAGFILSRTARSEGAQATVKNLNARIIAWWKMSGIFLLTLWMGPHGSILLFALISFLALREYMTLIRTSRADHNILFWSFFVITPLQYWLLYISWYGLFVALIPVYAFLFIPLRLVLEGDTAGFLDRAARIHWGLMICVYCISYAPALLILNIPGYRQDAKLLLFLVIVVQLSDVFQYVWGKLLGKRKIAPLISPNKTWEGFVGGILTATAIGGALWWMTPYSRLQALAMSLLITLLGFAGGLTMSAIKRDRSVKDFGAMIEGHGGILDRMDSVCFSAPIFFHVTRFFFGH
ncbi:MAG TPA: phosphatidate cytidylyltransferase [Candidatus Angelobacter sp.]|jgi:phosphatidate cytidylyltransferase|nr:phosphatidate cytidylyltransferase [Candidatus Angelobacter sp.]